MKRILLILSFLILSSLMLVGCNDNLGKEDLVATAEVQKPKWFQLSLKL